MNQNSAAILRSSDLRRPWQSPLGFPTLVGRLAAGEPLLLICREDEVHTTMTTLNSMLASPDCLARAHTLLSGLEQKTHDSVVSLMGQQANPLTSDDMPAVLDEIDAFLSADTQQTVHDRLACRISPDQPSQAITGREAMLFRLRRLNSALAEVKDCGFSAAFQDGVHSEHDHLTLRRYLIARSA